MAELPPSLMTPEAVRKLASDVVVAGFPLLVSDLIRRAHPLQTPRFLEVKSGLGNLPAGVRDDHPWMVRSSAVIDLSGGPLLVEFPELGRRYFSLTIFDALCRPWVSLGTSTGAAKSDRIVLGGSSLCTAATGDLPTFRSETELHWAVSLIMANADCDLPEVSELATQLRISSLGDPRPRSDEVSNGSLELDGFNPVYTLSRMSPLELLHRLETLAIREFPADLPASVTELRTLAQLRRGRDNQDSTSQAIEQGLADGLVMIAAASSATQARTGWQRMQLMAPHDNALTRAVLALQAAGAPTGQDRLTYKCGTDEAGGKLTGSEYYWLHFAPERVPPTDAIWSLAIAPEVPGKKHGDRPKWLGSNHGAARNEDGSLDILIASADPGGPAMYNWLQASPGAFELRFHLFRAPGNLANPDWQIPPLERLGSAAIRKLGLPTMPNVSPPIPAQILRGRGQDEQDDELEGKYAARRRQ